MKYKVYFETDASKTIEAGAFHFDNGFLCFTRPPKIAGSWTIVAIYPSHRIHHVEIEEGS